MTDTELKSCIGTIEMLRRLHGVMNVIDAGNCEKIIKVLSDFPKYKDAYGKGWDDGAKATYEHLKMCEEEQETSGDLISRDVVISTIYDNKSDFKNDFAQGFFADRIRDLPSVNLQEQKTGHWISHYDEDAKEGWYECDRCHTERAFNTDYCPDCGCRMVEPQKSENCN